jgi:two-component system sensor histidine kinase KdpD
MRRGILRIYLGAAPGVGKTIAMLDEGWRRSQRGADVVIGLVETHGRELTAARVRDLEIVPRRRTGSGEAAVEDMDLEAVLARHGHVVLIDELAHTNAPGGRHSKRWQDVEALLDAGCDVISTLNVQHFESLTDVIEKITGYVEHETVPDAVVRAADQIELVDMSPEALRRRLAHGNIYPADQLDATLANFFRVGNLGALRELALLWVADRVEERLQTYLGEQGITDSWETRERVVVALAGGHGGLHLIRRAARLAGRLQADLVGVHVGSSHASTDVELDRQRNLLSQLGGRYREVVGDDVALALASFAKAEKATQLVMGASGRSRLSQMFRGSVTASLLRHIDQIDVHIIAHDSQGPSSALPLPKVRPAAPLPRRRRIAAWAMCLVGLPVMTLGLTQSRSHVSLGSESLLSLGFVVLVAALGGLPAGLVASLVAFLLTNWYFVPPFHTLRVDGSSNVVMLSVFVTVAVVVSVLVTQSATRSAFRTREALRARAQAGALARTAGTLVGSTDPLPELVDQLRVTFELDAVAVLERADGAWSITTVVGVPVPSSPGDGTSLALDLNGDVQLVLIGRTLNIDDHAVLRAFADQLSLALEGRRLRADAETVASLAQANALRTALLQAVSHDLRTPLASIKASVSGLLQSDVAFSNEDRISLLRNIDGASDRLDRLVVNLLDMSRLQAGAVESANRAAALEDVIAAALASTAHLGGQITVDVADTLPLVMADPALLERAVANIVSNALAWSPTGGFVHIEAGLVQSHVNLRIIDRGPGIPTEARERIFEPFQRLGDRSNDAGVGLGLAIARGFVESMGATLEIDDTPGGGVTFCIGLDVAPETGARE